MVWLPHVYVCLRVYVAGLFTTLRVPFTVYVYIRCPVDRLPFSLVPICVVYRVTHSRTLPHAHVTLTRLRALHVPAFTVAFLPPRLRYAFGSTYVCLPVGFGYGLRTHYTRLHSRCLRLVILLDYVYVVPFRFTVTVTAYIVHTTFGFYLVTVTVDLRSLYALSRSLRYVAVVAVYVVAVVARLRLRLRLFRVPVCRLFAGYGSVTVPVDFSLILLRLLHRSRLPVGPRLVAVGCVCYVVRWLPPRFPRSTHVTRLHARVTFTGCHVIHTLLRCVHTFPRCPVVVTLPFDCFTPVTLFTFTFVGLIHVYGWL